MKKIILSLAVINSLSFAGGDIEPLLTVETELDETGFYLGAGIVAMSTRESYVSLDIVNETIGQDRLGNASILAGYAIQEYVSVEGRYSFALTDEDQVEIASQWSIFIKPIYKFEDDHDREHGENYFAIYALLGYGAIELEGVNEVDAKVDDSGFQWGLGVSYTFRKISDDLEYSYKDDWTVYADYINVGDSMDGHYYTGDGTVDADSFTVGLLYKF